MKNTERSIGVHASGSRECQLVSWRHRQVGRARARWAVALGVACGGSTEAERPPPSDESPLPGYLALPGRPASAPDCAVRNDIELETIEDFEFGAAGGWYLSNDVCVDCQEIINASDALRAAPLPDTSAEASADRAENLAALDAALDACRPRCLAALDVPNYFDNPPVAEPIVGGRCASRYAMHVKGGPFLEWGGNMGFNFSPPLNATDMDVVDPATGLTQAGQDLDGIAFWARLGDDGGNNTLRIEVGEKHTDQNYTGGPAGGPICTPDTTEANSEYGCDKFGYVALLRNDWQHFMVPFAEMRQQGWGMRADFFDLTAVMSFSFFYPQGTWDFWIDDLAFYRRTR